MQTSWIQESERYRYLTRDDLAALASLLSDPEVGRWLWFAPLTAEAVEQYFGPLLEQQEGELQKGQAPLTAVFAVEERDGEFLGMGAVVQVAGSAGGFEIGFQLGAHAWGRGVGTRLGRFLCAYAIEHGDAFRLEASCLEGNAGSVALLRKLGLKLEGTRPDYRLKGEVRHTELCFGRRVAELDRVALERVAQVTGLRQS